MVYEKWSRTVKNLGFRLYLTEINIAYKTVRNKTGNFSMSDTFAIKYFKQFTA